MEKKQSRKKQVEALKDLKSREQAKPIVDKFSNKNNQSIISNIFNDLIKKRKSIINELYESVDMNKLYFEYIGPTKDVNFYEYYDSKGFFSEFKNNALKFDEALKKKERVAEKNK